MRKHLYGLKDPIGTRKCLTNMIRDFHRLEEVDAVDIRRFRALCGSLRILLDFFVYERDTELDKRIDELESKLSGVEIIE